MTKEKQKHYETPGDQGWRHGTEDIHGAFKYRPEYKMTTEEFEDYKDEYKEARRGWDIG